MPEMTVEKALQLAMQHHTAGRLGEAERIYRQILQQHPNHDESLSLLGTLAHQAGHPAAGIDLMRRAIAINPNQSGYYNNLGLALTEVQKLDEAIAVLQRAVQLNSSSSHAFYNLGRVLAMQKRVGEAIDAYEKSTRFNPQFSPAWNNLANLYKETGKYQLAVDAYLKAIALEPQAGDLYSNLGNLYQEHGHIDLAAASFERALVLAPQLEQAYTGIGNIYKDQAKLGLALQAYRKALALKPTDVRANSNLLYAMFFDPDSDATAIGKEHGRWDRDVAAPLRAKVLPYANDRDPDRRLRIGYVSPDFFNQAESFFVLPLLQAHDRGQVEVHCYASVRRPDGMTARIKANADVWHEALHLSDEALAEQIRQDKVDVLIDLTMHMSFNRMLVFARKPAPVQIAWLAYPGTTGLKAMDYRITDSYMDPPDADQSWSAEQPIRLPDSWCVYSSLESESTVAPLPAERNGYLTFGSMNNFCKTNEQVLRLWAKTLAAIPGSRLILGAPEGTVRSTIKAIFVNHGVSPDRLEFIGQLVRAEYLRMYDRIDIALDPFPYNGITTTCDAMWKGVPVLTLAGQLPASRAGMSLLSTVGLHDFITHHPDQFVQKAVEYAQQIPRLGEIRKNLREQMRQSPLTDAPRFARNMEAAYRDAWKQWCSASKPPG